MIGGKIVVDPNGPPTQFCLEGIEHSGAWDDVILHAVLEGNGDLGSGWAEDQKSTTVIEVDLDIDSDNDEAFDVGRTSPEDKIEDSTKSDVDDWPVRPGKLLFPNTGSLDGVPGWADGFNCNSAATEDDELEGVKFVKVVIEKIPPYSDNCMVKFTYEASDPTLVTKSEGDDLGIPSHRFAYGVAPEGNFRLWLKDAAERRDAWKCTEQEQGSEPNSPKGDFVPGGTWVPWADLRPVADKATLFLEAVESPSSALGKDRIFVEMKEENPRTNEEATCNDAFRITTVMLNAEAITAWTTGGDDGNRRINPSGVIEGETAPFKIQLLPSDYPDTKIVWKPTYNAEVVAPAKGRQIDVIGKAVEEGDNLYSKVTVFMEGWYSVNSDDPTLDEKDAHRPWFEYNSLKPKTITVLPTVFKTGVDENGNTEYTATAEELQSVIAGASKIWSQVGVRLVMGAIEYLDDPDLVTIEVDNEWGQLCDLRNVSDDEIELYVVRGEGAYDRFGGMNQGGYGGLIGWLNPKGGLALFINNGGLDSVIFAHEVGHALGLMDIYCHAEQIDEIGEVVDSADVPDSEVVRSEWVENDWTNGVAPPRHYAVGRRQVEIIRDLLMYGRGDRAGSDIPLGKVYGVTTLGVISIVVDGEKVFTSSDPDLTQVLVGATTVLSGDRRTNH